jgi:hypothetical protein
MLKVNALQRPSSMQREAHSSGDADGMRTRSLPGNSVPGYILGPGCCANTDEHAMTIATSASIAWRIVFGLVSIRSASMVEIPP